MSIQHQIGEQRTTASKTSKLESSFNLNAEQSRWLEERDKVSYKHPYL